MNISPWFFQSQFFFKIPLKFLVTGTGNEDLTTISLWLCLSNVNLGVFIAFFYQICSNKKKASWLQALHCCFLFCSIINIHMYIVSEEYWNVLYRDHVIFLTKNYHKNKKLSDIMKMKIFYHAANSSNIQFHLVKTLTSIFDTPQMLSL